MALVGEQQDIAVSVRIHGGMLIGKLLAWELKTASEWAGSGCVLYIYLIR